MSLLVDVREVPWRILEAVTARILANRERMKRREQAEKVRGLTRPRPQQRKLGATMSSYKEPEPLPLVLEDDPYTLGWYGIDGGVFRVACGNGAASVEVSTTGTPEPEPIDDRNWLSYTPTYSGTWSDWKHWGAGYWQRRRRISSTTLTFQYRYGRSVDGTVLLPAPGAGVVVHKQAAVNVVNSYTLSAENTALTEPWDLERGIEGEIFEVVYVQGSDTEDPDALFAGGVRRRGAELLVNLVPTLVTEGATTYSTSRNGCAIFNHNRVRALTTPAAMSAKMADIFGTIPTPTSGSSGITMPGYSMSVGNPPGLGPVIDTLTYAGITLNVALWSMTFLDDGTVPVTATTVSDATSPDDFRIRDLLNFTLIQSLGYANITPTASTFGAGREGGTPFIFDVINGLYPYASTEIPDSLSAVLASVAPLPPKFQITTAQSTYDPLQYIINDLHSYYTSAATSIPFRTFANTPANYRPDAEWSDFGVPTIRGNPSTFTKKLVPQPSRVAFVSPPSWLLTTTYGSDAVCRAALTALGFTPSDLRP